MEEPREPGNIFEQKKAYEDLQSSPAFRKLVGEVQTQVDGLQNEILFAPITCEADMFLMERKKGMLEGRLSIQATLSTLLENLDYDYQQAVTAKEQNNVAE
jgi:hypothetical protein